MDPSAAPWRVLDADDPPNPAGGDAGRTQPASPAASLPISPLTAAAALGVVILAVGAFILAASDGGGGTVQATGGSLAPIEGSAGVPAIADGAGNDTVVVEIVGRDPRARRVQAAGRCTHR